MNRTSSPEAAHLDEGDIVRYYDRELEDADRKWVEDHLGACRACSDRLDLFAEQSSAVTGTMIRADLPLPRLARRQPAKHTAPPPRLRTWQRAAAIAVIVGGAAFATQPVRAWMVDRWDGLREILAGSQPPVQEVIEEAAPVSPELTAPPNTLSIGFEPTTDSLVLRIATRQASGEIQTQATDDVKFSAEIIGGGDETIDVLPDGVFLRNTAASTARYRLHIPEGIRVVVIAIEGEPPIRIVWDGSSPSQTIDLAAIERGSQGR